MTFINFKFDEFLVRITNMGYNIHQDKKAKLIEFEKKYRENTLDTNIFDGYEECFSKQEQKLIILFKQELPYMNYINFILILNSLTNENLKNINRYLNIKWNITKNKLENDITYVYLKDIHFLNINIEENILEKFIDNILQFSNLFKKEDNIHINLNLVFVLNTIYDYFFIKTSIS